MALIPLAEAVRTAGALVAPRNAGPPVLTSIPGAGSAPLAVPGNYEGYARAFSGNDLVFSAIDQICTSAAEPPIIGHRSSRVRLRAIAQKGGSFEQRLAAVLNALQRERHLALQARWLNSQGVPSQRIDAWLLDQGVLEEVTDHPLIHVLNNPNPFMSRFELWATVLLDLHIAGNAYLFKARGDNGKTEQLWRLRPDRVKVVPSPTNYIDHYEYRVGLDKVDLAVRDVIHFKTRAAADIYYGMPPLMPLLPWVSLANFMRDFVGAFFRNGGQPGAVLTIKGEASQEMKDDIRQRFRGQYGGQSGWFDLLVLDNVESSFTPVTMQLGQRGLVVPELEEIVETRLAAAFKMPVTLLGGYAALRPGSYASKDIDWQNYWKIALAPIYKDLSDRLNLSFLPEYPDLDELLFDLSKVKALQEDFDKLCDRWRKDLDGGGLMIEEYRLLTGRDPYPQEGHFLLPIRSTLVPAPLEDVGAEQPPPLTPAKAAAIAAAVVGNLLPGATDDGSHAGRPRIEEDPAARAVYEQAVALREANPRMPWEVVAERLGIAERTLRRYRTAFEED